MLLEILLVHFAAMASPGPNVLLVTRTAGAESRRAGVCSAAGIATGSAVWAILAAVGLAFVLARVHFARDVLRVLGGCYLVYLGARTFRSAERGALEELPAAAADARAWRRGLLTNLSNPKAAVFFLGIFATLLPAHASAGLRAAAVGVIGVDALVWHSALAYLFSTPRARGVYLRRRDAIDRVAGGAIAAFGATFAVLG